FKLHSLKEPMKPSTETFLYFKLSYAGLQDTPEGKEAALEARKNLGKAIEDLGLNVKIEIKDNNKK
ncbi:MAG: hypothetical protein KAQ92_03610, partial [Candidatus Aenigmarchaeota archaeon]|nr:hypothetical protein [Candidatus Aenigmarchaeota archaeon]